MTTSLAILSSRLDKLHSRLIPKIKPITRLPYAIFDMATGLPILEHRERVERWDRAGIVYNTYGFNPDCDGDGREDEEV